MDSMLIKSCIRTSYGNHQINQLIRNTAASAIRFLRWEIRWKCFTDGKQYYSVCHTSYIEKVWFFKEGRL